MHLIGSLTEERLREELLRSNAALRDSHADSALSALLRDRGVDLATAFVLDWIPEQSEDFFTVLDGNRRVLKIELPRGMDAEPPIVETVPFASFREMVSKGSRMTRLRFTVAVDLVSRASGA